MGINYLTGWLLELRYGLRMVAKQLEVTFIVVLTLGIAIGMANTMFGVFNAVLIESLPFKDPDKLVAIWQVDQSNPNIWRPAATGNFVDWRRLNRSFETVVAVTNNSMTLTSFEDPDTPLMQRVSYGYFETLGIRPILGRTFLAEEDRPGSRSVVILSYELWQRRFGKDPNIIGRNTELDHQPYDIIGVMPPDFDNPMLGLTERPQAWLPLALAESGLDRRNNDLIVIARLSSAATLEQARKELESISAELENQYPDTNRNLKALVTPIDESAVRQVRSSLFLLLGAVLLVLLIASCNVANLLLARSVTRYREFAIRRALGASVWHLFRQLLVENILLMIPCAAMGLIFAFVGSKTVGLLIPVGFNIPKIDFSINRNLILFTLVISLLLSLIFSLIPILHVISSNPAMGLNIESGRMTNSRRIQRLQRGLVIGEIALSLILLIGAGLMVKSFVRLKRIDNGFDPFNTLTFRVSTRGPNYKESSKRKHFFKEVQKKLETIPGTLSVGAAQVHPFSPKSSNTIVTLDGEPIPEPGKEQQVIVVRCTPSYINTMKIPLLNGRLFTSDEYENSRTVAVISKKMLHQLWKDKDPIGESFTIRDARGIPYQVIGVVGDVRTDVFPPEPQPVVYVPISHDEAPASIAYVIRTTADPLSFIDDVKRQVWSVDHIVPVYLVRSMDNLLTMMDWRTRFIMTLLALFSTVSMGLAVMGIFAILSYTISTRSREIGIRMALGASRWNILMMVLKSGLLLTLFGIIVGILGSLLFSHLLKSQLYSITPVDPLTFLSLPILLALVALLATLIPAVRATTVEPAMVLRKD